MASELAFIAAWLMVANVLVESARAGEAPESNSPPALTFMDVLRIGEAARRQGNALTELDAVRALADEYNDVASSEYKAIAGVLLTLGPAVGNYREALRYADSRLGHPRNEEPTPHIGALRGYTHADALDALRKVASAHQVIMINEAHHVPQHRAFTIELLQTLRAKGFMYLAAETLSDSDTTLSGRGYPVRETGYYTTEPVYGDLIRTALRLGYRVVAYEAQSVGDPQQRELDQARNLVKRILDEAPKAKILIHAGYNHINESGTLAGAPTMAQRFKELTGIDPLTIDQTEMTEHSARKYEHPIYRHAVARGWVSRPTVFQNAQGEFWTLERGKRDITLFHPRSRYVNNRPHWLKLGDTRRAYQLPHEICGKYARCLVRARFSNEGPDAVPIDQIEVRGRNRSTLMLPDGNFVIEIEDPSGRLLGALRATLPARFGASR